MYKAFVDYYDDTWNNNFLSFGAKISADRGLAGGGRGGRYDDKFNILQRFFRNHPASVPFQLTTHLGPRKASSIVFMTGNFTVVKIYKFTF